MTDGKELLHSAAAHWYAMGKFRRDRDRNKRYCFGDQWSDLIECDGRKIRESEYIEKTGAVALKNNLIRRLVRTVMGVYEVESRKYEEETLEFDEANSLRELNMRGFEEFLISGLVVQRKWYGKRDGVWGCWTDNVSPDNFIMDTSSRDFRGWDVSIVGELHDLHISELFARFGRSPEECRRLREIYSQSEVRHDRTGGDFGYDTRSPSFYMPDVAGLCRVIEVWQRENREYYDCHDPLRGEMYAVEAGMLPAVREENAHREKRGEPLLKTKWRNRTLWRYYFLSPAGDVLASGDTPYTHGSHPFVFKAYPYIDGEIHSFVADVIDQQRFTNRLITMYDWIMRSSAKGVLMVPEESLGRMTPEEFAEQWTRFNGVIVYRPRPGIPLPQQISSNSTHVGISELLTLQLKLFEDISGVSSSLQGKTAAAGTSGALYSQQTYNATMSLMDLLETYSKFLKAGRALDMANYKALSGFAV